MSQLARLAVLVAATACSPPDEAAEPDAGAAGDADASQPSPDAAGGGADATPDGVCPAGGGGLACLFDLVDEVTGDCDPARLEDLRDSLAARHGDLPAWLDGRALFVTYDSSAAVAGGFNDWAATALVTASVCGSNIFVADAAIASGHYPYKLVRDQVWSLDAENWAFEFDDFAGNPDGVNSVLNTYDSGVGHLVQPDQRVCSTELDNCRPLTTYLPAGYGAPANATRRYPVVFMHDGQNIFDDHDCCFGHTGWEVNVQLDADIAAGLVQEVVIVGFDHAGAGRGDEYGFSTEVGGLQETFMAFQTGQVQPTAASYWRLDDARYYTAGSSLGGLIAFRLALAYPGVYAGAASLSGSFWVGEDTDTAMRDFLAATGKVAASLYMDHGGTAATGTDNYASNVELRDLLAAVGWSVSTSPDCTTSSDSLCYFHDVGATHNELAWRDRSFRFLRYFFAR